VVNKAAEIKGLPGRPCTTVDLRLHSAPASQFPADTGFPNSGAYAPEFGKLKMSRATVIQAGRSEMARTVEDVLARRTRALFLDARAALVMAPQVAELMAAELNCDESWQRSQIAAFTDLAGNYLWR
jgi:glycerol-3-phosphate dehydrogenase